MKAAVLEQIGKPLAIREIDLAIHRDNKYGLLLLSEGQVLARMLSAGICGAQLQEIDGKKGDLSHLPHLLGHEGCGIVERTGLGVKTVHRGDKVVVHWRKGAGMESDLARFGNVKAGPCTTFSQFTVVSESRVTVIPQDVPGDLGALLGCCLSTALATSENIARIKPGESVLIVGAGGVGLAMILAAKIAGAARIDCTDPVVSKRKLAFDIGVSAFIEAYREDYYFGGHRYDVIIDTAGAMTRATLLKNGGRYILVGQPVPEMTLQPFTAGWIFKGNGGRVEATNGGGFEPLRDIPRYVQMWRDGKLNGWEKLITHRISLEQINDGIQLMRDGKAGRVMIEFE